MAITRAQQVRQMLNGGGAPSNRGDIGGPPGGGATSMGSGRDFSPPSNQPSGGAGGDRIIDVAERKRRQDLRDLAIRGADEKIEERLEPFRNLGSNQRKFQNFLTKISPIAAITSRFGSFNNRDFLVDKVLDAGQFKYKGDVLTREQFVNLSEEEKEDVLDSYLGQRNMGKIDAYGNPIGDRGGDGINQIIPVDTTFTQAPLTTEQEPEVEEPFQLSRRFRAEGGIMNSDVVGGEFDFESARQMYGLGKLVKKVTRTVKKIAKSPIGKAALLYTGAAGLGALGTGTGFAGFKANFMSPTTLFGSLKKTGQNLGLLKRFTGTSDGPNMLRERIGPLANLGVGSLITGVSALAGLLTPEEETQAEDLARGEGIDIEAARNAILAARREQYAMDSRARRFKAEGGSMKEPVAKKTMPLLDMGGKEMDLREDGGFVPIGRMEKADDVPARLSKNEFVFTADAVRNAGDGDVDKGAEVMYNMMKNLESGGDVSEESQGLEGARRMFQTSQRLEEVL